MSFPIYFENNLLKQDVNTYFILNPHDIATDFCNLFYQEMHTNGYTGVINLFDSDAQCIYNDKKYVGFCNVIAQMASEGIVKTAYDNLNFSVLTLNVNQIHLTITGNIQGIYFTGYRTKIHNFVDIFVLTLKNNNLFVSNYLNKLF